MATMTKNADEKVTINCPRCGGHGRLPLAWKPDFGICYRCGGKQQITINVRGHLNTLWMLRNKYKALYRELFLAERAGDNVVAGVAREALNYCTQDGQRVRSDLELAGVSL